jgi:catechol 2,3-dioxygenase-like lactoylglutathione lyase family enzyme
MTTQTETTNGATAQRETMPFRFEVTTLPVADVDRAKEFYVHTLGWREDIDFEPAPGVRGVQVTPPGSPASIQFGSGPATVTAPLQNLYLVVDDIVAARDELVSRGVEVSDFSHLEFGKGILPGLDPNRATYASRVTFADPDGNTWLVQEISDRLPGRVEATDIEQLAELLHETAEHHDRFEKATPPHDWWHWYAAYFNARQEGETPAEADATADRYMAEVKHIVTSA